jgi:hypothetical protein
MGLAICGNSPFYASLKSKVEELHVQPWILRSVPFRGRGGIWWRLFGCQFSQGRREEIFVTTLPKSCGI